MCFLEYYPDFDRERVVECFFVRADSMDRGKRKAEKQITDRDSDAFVGEEENDVNIHL